MVDRHSPQFLAKLIAAFYEKKSDVKLGNFKRYNSPCGEICRIVFGISTLSKRRKIYSRWLRNWGGVKELFELEESRRPKIETIKTSNVAQLLSFGRTLGKANVLTDIKPVETQDSEKRNWVISKEAKVCNSPKESRVLSIDTSLVVQGITGAEESKVKIEFPESCSDPSVLLYDSLTTRKSRVPEVTPEVSDDETLSVSEVSSLCETDTASELECEPVTHCETTNTGGRAEESKSEEKVKIDLGFPCSEDIEAAVNKNASEELNENTNPAVKKKRSSKLISGTTSKGLRFDKCKVVLVDGIFRFDVGCLEESNKESHYFFLDLMDKFADPCAIQIKSKKYYRSHVVVYSYCKMDRCRLFVCRLFKSSPTYLQISSTSETANHSKVKFRRVFGGARMSKAIPSFGPDRIGVGRGLATGTNAMRSRLVRDSGETDCCPKGISRLEDKEILRRRIKAMKTKLHKIKNKEKEMVYLKNEIKLGKNFVR